MVALKLKQLPERFAEMGYVCSEHFTKGDFKRNLRAELLGSERVRARRELIPLAVPYRFCFSRPERKQPSKKTEHARVSEAGRPA